MDTDLVSGILEVRTGGTLMHVGRSRHWALPALLCHANRVASRERLVDELQSLAARWSP